MMKFTAQNIQRSKEHIGCILDRIHRSFSE